MRCFALHRCAVKMGSNCGICKSYIPNEPATPVRGSAVRGSAVSVLRTMFVLAEGNAIPMPLPNGELFSLCASSTHSAVVIDGAGSAWRLQDGVESTIRWRKLASDCADLRALSVHDYLVIGITRRGKCRVLDGAERMELGLQMALQSRRMPPIIDLVGHCPEEWLLSRTSSGEVWAFGPKATHLTDGRAPLVRIPLPAPCCQLACSRHGVALLSDASVYVIGADARIYPCSAEPTAGLAVRVEELSGESITRVAAGRHTSAAIAASGTVLTWGSSELNEGVPFGQPGYAGELHRPAPVGEWNDADGESGVGEGGWQWKAADGGGIEFDPVPRPIDLSAITAAGARVCDLAVGATGSLVLAFTDGRVLRPGLGGSLDSDGTAWQSSMPIELLPACNAVFVAA